MAARIRDAKLDSPTARSRLPVRGKPYFRAIGEGLYLGYRKGKSAGKWVARVYTGEGEYVVETIATADDAAEPNGEDVLTFYQAQERARETHRRLTGRGEAKGPFTVADAMADYLEWLEHRGKQTRDTRNRINVHILPALGKVEVAKLTAKQIRQWMKALADAPPRNRSKKGSTEPNYRATANDEEAKRRRKNSTNRTLTVLKAALNHAWKETKKAASDDEWRRVSPFEDVDSARVNYLQVPEAKRLINAAEPGFRNMAHAALQTGCRYGELCRLRVSDFDPRAGTLTIRRTKSGKPRHVTLTEEGQEFFRQQTVGRAGTELMLRNEARLKRSAAKGIDDAGEWRSSEQVRAIADACERAKIDPPVGFHQLRHTWASLAVMQGVPLMVVARNLGHSDTRMAEKHYAHLAASYLTDAIRAGAPRFGAVDPSNVRAL